jgi:UDP-N-acetylmuramoyl-L-alanyl-D-glutamate--2,6-diaminopimelate ligase
MKLRDLLGGTSHRLVRGDEDIEIGGIAIDSRLVEPGDLFVAIAGREADGHDFIPAVRERGAAAVLVTDEWVGSAGAGAVPLVADPRADDAGPAAGARSALVSVPDTRAVLSELVNRFHGYPSRGFTLVGVTGTNGKTSVATLIDRVWTAAGFRTGLLGTIDNYCLGEVMDVRRTTPTNPDCVELGEIMSRMAAAGVSAVVMEVTSMGLKMGRVSSCDFDVAVFTNLSPEHLDDHGSMEDYKASKLRLFDLAKTAVINGDDPAATEFAARARGAVVRYGIADADGRDLYADDIVYAPGGVSFDMVAKAGGAFDPGTFRVTLATPAAFAVYNALAAAAACALTGVALWDAAAALSGSVEIAGRYQVLTSRDGVAAIVDYAHTAGALENLLEAVRSNPSYGRVISVFGCGGDRDPGKRAPMGEISGRLADYTVITSDNPRTEDPGAIIAQIEEGVAASGGAYGIEPDRAKAVAGAIRAAAPGDVVVIAGKGHEDYQIIGREKIHLDDRETAAAALGLRDDGRAAGWPESLPPQRGKITQ